MRKYQKNIFNNIKLIVYDFDGVLTDNKVLVSSNGVETVICSRADGLAMHRIKKMGISQIILSTEESPIVKIRARKLGVPAINNVGDKKKTLKIYCRKHEINLSNVMYIGNDINDFEAMRIAGFPICPSDAHDKIKAVSKLVLSARGGCGVARELHDCLCSRTK